MKTTLEIPDPVFRKAKARAAEQGIPLRQFVTEAVQAKINTGLASGEKPWMRMAGGLRHLHKETVRINRLIEDEFEKIEPEGPHALPILSRDKHFDLAGGIRRMSW